MAAACYEKEVVVGATHGHGHHGVTSTPAPPGQTVLPPAATTIGSAAAAAATTTTSTSSSTYKEYKEYKEVTTYKDYSQPLHVDCSVEYELPSQAKPPPGGGEPLLMIHPCYYRRAERERRSPFVNNLPPPTSTPISLSRSRTSRRNTSTVATSGTSLTTSSLSTAAAQNTASSYHAALTAAATLTHQHQQQQQQQQQSVAPSASALISADEKAVISDLLSMPSSAVSLLDLKSQQQQRQGQQTSGATSQHRQPAVGIAAVSCRGCRPQPHPYARLQPWASAVPAPQQAPAAPTRTRAKEPAGAPEHANSANTNSATSRRWGASKRRHPQLQMSSSSLQQQHSLMSTPSAAILTPQNSLESLTTSQNGHHVPDQPGILPSTGNMATPYSQGAMPHSGYETGQRIPNSQRTSTKTQSLPRCQSYANTSSTSSAATKGHRLPVSTHPSDSDGSLALSSRTHQSHQSLSTGLALQKSQLSHSTSHHNLAANQVLSQLSHPQQYQSMSVSNTADQWLLGSYLPASTTNSSDWCHGGKGCTCVTCTSRQNYPHSQGQSAWYYPQGSAAPTPNELHRLFQHV